jgi:PilZ domain
MERRKNPRYKARFDALYSSGAQEGAGVLAEISYAGVRLEESSIRPAIGTRVQLYIFLRPVQPFELVGRVVRHTESGFALTLDPPSLEVCRLVDDVAALVTVSAA